MNRNKLIIFNLELDLDSRVLASAHDWVEEFAKKYTQVFVYSTHVGRTDLPSNVVVIEVGGGSTLTRIRAFSRLLKSLLFIFRYKNELQVFHHMSSRTVAIVGPVIKLLNVPQILWYSHSKADFALKLFQFIPDKILSSSQLSVPIKNKKKVWAIGHGIKVSRFDSEENLLNRSRSDMIALGRIVPIKNLEEALEAIANLNRDISSEIGVFKVIGPSGVEPVYESKITEIANTSALNVEILNSLDYAKIPEILARTSILFSGTPISVDKVCLEAAMSGCFIVSKNLNVLKLTGMDLIYPSLEIKGSVLCQLEWISKLTREEELLARRTIIRRCRGLNSLESLVGSIEKYFQEI